MDKWLEREESVIILSQAFSLIELESISFEKSIAPWPLYVSVKEAAFVFCEWQMIKSSEWM